MALETPVADAPETDEQEETLATAANDTVPASGANESPADESSGDGAGDGDESSAIDEGLAELARSYQLDPSAWHDKASLEKAVTQFDRLLSHYAQHGFGEPAGQRQQPPTNANGEQKPVSLKRLEMALKPLPKDQYDEAQVQFSEGVVQYLQSLHDSVYSQLEAYEQRFGQLAPYQEKVNAFEQFMDNQARERYATDMDGAFSKLGPEWEDRFGKGAMGSLSPHSPQVADRKLLEKELISIQHGDALMKRNQTFQQQFDRALRAAFGEHLPTIERRKIAKQAAGRQNGAAARPNRRNGAPLKHEDAVLQKLAGWVEKVSE